MEKMKVTFLGTGSAVPTKKKNHTGILISFADENILIDCGEGIQRQFKYADISPTKLTKILITHWHGDHFFGLPGLLQTLEMCEYKRKLIIYGPPGSLKYLNHIRALTKDIRIDLELKEVSDCIMDGKYFSINVKSMKHGTPTNAYSIILKDKVRLDKKKLRKYKLPNSPLLKELQNCKDIVFNGRKIKSKEVCYIEKGKKIVVVLDTLMNNEIIKFSEGADLLIAEASFSFDEKEKALEAKHLTATESAFIAKKAKVKNLSLIHLSQRYEQNPKIIEKEAKKIFKKARLANDLDVIEV